MNNSSPVTALFAASGFTLILCLWVRAVKTGRVFSKGAFVEKKKEPAFYWASMVAYAIAGLGLLFCAAASIFPDLVRHSQR